MKRCLILLIATLFAGCVQSGGAIGPVPILAEQDVLNGQARLIYLCCVQDGNSTDTDTDDSTTPSICSCGGTGRSGDGIGPCECVANGGECKHNPRCGSQRRNSDSFGSTEPQEEPEVQRDPVVMLLVITGEPGECPACIIWGQKEKPILHQSGWKNGEHYEELTYSEFFKRFNVELESVPSFMVTIDGKLQTDSLLRGYKAADVVADHVNSYRTGHKQKTSRSIVRIVTQGERKNGTVIERFIGYGSGVVIESKPGRFVVLTADHCVRDGKSTDVEIFEGRNVRKLAAKVLKQDQFADIALLEISTDDPLPAVELHQGDVPKGSELQSWGCDEGEEPRFRQTIVSDLYEADGVRVLRTKGDASKGWEDDPKSGRSGGGLFYKGKLVAIYSAANREAKNGLCIMVDAIKRLK